MEAIDPASAPVSTGWVSRLVEVLAPLSVRADRLGAMALFAGLPRTDLEFAAGFLRETKLERGTRITIQGRPCSGLWLILDGEALVSADARPLRVASRGDTIGAAAMLYGIKSPATTIALGPISAFEAGRDQFRQLIGRRSIRLRLAAAASDQLPARRPAARASRSKAELPGG